MLLLLVLAAQTGGLGESGGASSVPGAAVDSLIADSTYQDSIGGGVSVVNFRGDTIIFYTDTKEVLLLHNAYVSYGDLTVYSDSIRFSTQERMLSAYKGARLISSGATNDSVVGSQMLYAVETQKGVMYEGKTQIEKGYFYGQGIWLVEENVLHITRGYYTTCDREKPHYDFYGSQLKVFIDDMVIARPIFLRVRTIPVLAAPFWYLPIGSSRKSGLLPFKFGHSETEGWFVKMVRYYWAVNDYSDAMFNLDIMTIKGFRPGVDFNWLYGPRGMEYAQGGFSTNYINEADTRHQRWTFALNNTSNIPDGTRITADLNFQSDQNYILDYIEDEDSLTLLLDQTTLSNISITRSLFGRSTALSLSRWDDLRTGDYTMTLPAFNFSWPTVTLWDFFTLGFGSFRVNNNYLHDVSLTVDTLSGDTVRNVANSRETGFGQPLSLYWGYTLLGAYRFSQSWVADQSLIWRQDSLGDTLIRGATYSLTNSISTDLFRIFGVNFWGMNGILHRVTPTLSYTIRPSNGEVYPWVAYPRFDTTLSAHSVNLSIAQDFQTKIRDRYDSTSYNKQNLLNLSTGIGYNLLNDSLTPVNASLRLPSGLPLYATLSGTYNIYTDSFTVSTDLSASLDQIIFPLLGWRENARSPVTDTSDTTALSDTLSVYLDTLSSMTPDTLPRDTTIEDSLEHAHEKKETFVERFSRSRFYLTNRWGFGGDFTQTSKTQHMISARTQLFLPLDIEINVGIGLNFDQPKEQWQDYIASSSFSIIKGLHCWEAVFEVVPNDWRNIGLDNMEWNLYLRIKELPDIQIGKGLLSTFGVGQ